MAGWRRWIALGVLVWAAMTPARPARASADVRLDKDFIGGIIEKLPPVTFEKPGQYRGIVHGFQLIAIEARTRQLLVGCKIDGEFHAPVNGPITDRVGPQPADAGRVAEVRLRPAGAGQHRAGRGRRAPVPHRDR